MFHNFLGSGWWVALSVHGLGPVWGVTSDMHGDIWHSQWVRQKPKHLDNFEVQLPPSIVSSQPTPPHDDSVVYPFSHFVCYDKFSQSHKAFLTAIASHDEPKTYF